MFEALLVLDVPGKLFQANLSAQFQIQADDPVLLDVGGGVDVAFTWADHPPADMWHVYLGERKPSERRIHARVFKVVEGDSWLMVNRTRTIDALKAIDPERLGEAKFGGSVTVGGDWRFGPVRAWLQAGMEGGAGISVYPEQFNGFLRVFGGAGLSAFCCRIEAGIEARAEVKAPTPWWLYVELVLSIKIDLFLFKFERSVQFPLEWGKQDQPLPEPVSGLAELAVEHTKADEDQALAGAVVPSDAKPLITFNRPVVDRAHFGSPGLVDITPENLGARTFSYQLRHITLQTDTGQRDGDLRQYGEFSGTRRDRCGCAARPRRLDGHAHRFDVHRPRHLPGHQRHGRNRTAGRRGAARVVRVPTERVPPQEAVQVTAVAADGTAVLTLAAALNDPAAFEGGQLRKSDLTWPVLAATATRIRIRTTDKAVTAGAVDLESTDPSTIEALWYATAGPGDASANTRLSIGARTPFAYYRRNDRESVHGLDPFTGPYACGPDRSAD